MGLFQVVANYLWDCVLAVIGWVHAYMYDLRGTRIEASGLGAKRVELVNLLPDGSRVLEVGAGTGATAMAGVYDKSDRFSRIVMCEPDDALRSRMSRKLSQRKRRGVRQPKCGFEVIRASLPNLPCADAEFDAIVLFMVASHLSRRSECLKELYRVLARDGVLVFIDHVAGADSSDSTEQSSANHQCTETQQHSHRHSVQDRHEVTDARFNLVWLFESLHFQKKLKRHHHGHGNGRMSFEPLIDAFEAAGFQRVRVEVFKTVNSGMPFLDELISGVWRKSS